MRIRIIRTPAASCIDGIRLDWFRVGLSYSVGNLVGAYLVAEGWAEPVPFGAADCGAELDPDVDQSELPNLRREFYPPYYDGPPSLALDRRRRRRGG